MFYNLHKYENPENIVVLSIKHYQEVRDTTNSSKLIIQAGNMKYQAQAICDESLSEQTAGISSCLLESLSLPLELQYQIIFQPGLIIIGPVVGLLLEKRQDQLTSSFLVNSQNYLNEYHSFGGLVYVFSLEGINFQTNKVKGFYYCPGEKGPLVWKEGVFPLPGAIFRRIGLKRIILDKLREFTNNRIFNSYYFNKWDFFSFVPTGHSLREYLPETILFSSILDLDDFIDRYGAAYLKPVDGSKGAGVFCLGRTGNNYRIKAVQRRGTWMVQMDKFNSWFEKSKHRGRYLVQQPIQSIRYKDRMVDFRVIMQKDGSGIWQCTCTLARVGRTGGVASNFGQYGFLSEGKQFFLEKLKLDTVQSDYLLSQLKSIALLVCQSLDENGSIYADLGLDLALDDSSKVWLLEVNKRHDHRMPLYAGEKLIYARVKTNPVNYAVYLTGFKSKQA